MLAPLCHALLLALILGTARCAFPPSLRYILPVSQNRILDMNATCDSSALNVTVSMEQPFKGLLFAKDFSQECGSTGTLSNITTVHLPTSGCGVRLTSDREVNEEGMHFTVTVVVQQDRHLRQITDQERTVRCYVPADTFSLTSKPMIEVVKKEFLRRKKESHRTGRMKDWSKSEGDVEIGKELHEALSAARAWMQVVPVKDNLHPGTLQVGEEALLMVKATLPVGIGWKVVDCNAHDGLGDSSQKLLDENGCALDELVMPALLKGHSRPIAMMRHQEAVSKFAAFKFPDRDRLHLSCALELCRGVCEQIECTNSSSLNARLGRTISKGEPGEILDKLEVFNSIQVTAPDIELDDARDPERARSSDPFSTFAKIPGDRTFCVSPSKIAITFCILGLIFLCAVVVAACALLRARRSSGTPPYYTRSIFSSSSGGSAYGGSKLLIRESPCLGQPPIRNFPYGKMF